MKNGNHLRIPSHNFDNLCIRRLIKEILEWMPNQLVKLDSSKIASGEKFEAVASDLDCVINAIYGHLIAVTRN